MSREQSIDSLTAHSPGQVQNNTFPQSMSWQIIYLWADWLYYKNKTFHRWPLDSSMLYSPYPVHLHIIFRLYHICIWRRKITDYLLQHTDVSCTHQWWEQLWYKMTNTHASVLLSSLVVFLDSSLTSWSAASLFVIGTRNDEPFPVLWLSKLCWFKDYLSVNEHPLRC